MQQAFLDVNGVRTNVVTYGRWVEESPESGEPEEIVLVIPGNPGVTGFYKMFLHILHERTGLPLWTLGHAGHEVPQNNAVCPIPELKGNEELFGLKGQIEHKVKFFEEYVPENARLHLVGHSIGSYMILELMQNKSIESRVASVNLLFPAIERMAETRNGKFMTRFIKPIVWLILFLSLIYAILPSVIRNFITYIYMRVVCLPRMHLKNVINFINPPVLEKVFSLAFEELDLVKERNNEVIKRNVDKIRFWYGADDGWTLGSTSKSYCDNLKRDIPEVRAEITEFEHAFVLRQSKEVGNLVADQIVSLKQ